MELENVRREILKRYYERAYGGVSKDAFEGATLEDLALAKIEMPLFSERNLLSRAPLRVGGSWRRRPATPRLRPRNLSLSGSYVPASTATTWRTQSAKDRTGYRWIW